MATIKQITEGLLILSKYAPEADVFAEHDTITTTDTQVTEEEAKQLDELGWFMSTEYECWTHFT